MNQDQPVTASIGPHAIGSDSARMDTMSTVPAQEDLSISSRHSKGEKEDEHFTGSDSDDDVSHTHS